MSGGGESKGVDPGAFMTVLAPLMRVVGFGISARGGALGPALAQGGEEIEGFYRARRQQASDANLIQMLQDRQRTLPMSPGTPGTPAVPAQPAVPSVMSRPEPPPVAPPPVPERPQPVSSTAPDQWGNVTARFPDANVSTSAAPPPQDLAPDAERIITGQSAVAGSPGTPAVPPVTRSFTSPATQSESLDWLRQQDMPPSVRSLTLDRFMRLRRPTDVERPQQVQEEYAQAQAEQAKGRTATALQPVYEPSPTPAQMSHASAETGHFIPPPAPAQKWETHGNTQVLRDTRSGNVLKVQALPRSPEQDETLSVDVPTARQRLAESVQGQEITAQQANVAQTLLDQAARTGDMKPFLGFMEKVALAKPNRPTGSEQQITNWLAANGLPDTPQTREKARQAFMGEKEASQIRVGTNITKMQADVARKAGGEATKELGKIEHQAGLLDQAEDMAGSMEEAIRVLAKYNRESSTFNTLRQMAASKGGFGPNHKQVADALAAVQAANARYASIAQGVEGVTGNRLTQTLADRMRAMHVHEEEPLSRNLARLTELRKTIASLRTQINKHSQDVIRRQQGAMESVGKSGTPLSAYSGVASRAGSTGGDEDLGDEP